MGTRSRIAVMHGEVCKSIYCHWDGYLEHNGRVLMDHYDSAKANELVSLGDLSSLRSDIGTPHSFSQFELEEMDREDFVRATENMCTFYGRDRGETGTEYKVSHTFAEFLDQCDKSCAEYYYVMKNDTWYVGTTYDVAHPLSKVLVPLAEVLTTVEETA